MRKKLKKYIKKLLICIIVFMMVFNSYATIAASDGSAFITKGELKVLIADFNSRLTTFEAGINSKIDSQVTSYLDRNGIWSGRNQTINIESYEIKTSYHSTNYKLFYGTNDDIPYGNAIIVKKLSKTGLAVMDYDYTAVNYWNIRNQVSDMYNGGIDRFSYWYDAWYMFDEEINYAWNEKISTVTASKKLLGRSIIMQHNLWNFLSGNSSNYMYSPASGNFWLVWATDIPATHCNRYYFVEKDKVLLWKFSGACGGYATLSTNVVNYEANTSSYLKNIKIVVY